MINACPPFQNWGSGVYQPDEPINTVLDMWAIPAALIRGLWAPEYAANSLTFTPALPENFTNFTQNFPIIWGDYLIFPSAVGSGPISGVTINGIPLPASQWTAVNATLLWDSLPPAPANLSLAFTLGSDASLPRTGTIRSQSPRSIPFESHQTRETSIRVLKSLAFLSATPILWLDATTLSGTLTTGSTVNLWPDISGSDANASQSDPSLCPVFNATGMGSGLPTVDFNGASTFLSGSLMLPSESTVIAVFSNAPLPPITSCCSGIFYSDVGCNGMGMKVVPSTSDDSVNATVMAIDWSGSPDSGIDDLTGRQVSSPRRRKC